MTTSHDAPDPRALSTMLLVGDVHRHDWSAAELRDMLRHQMAAPLHLSVGTLSAEAVHQLRSARPPLNALLTLGELFKHSQPPLELLKLVKRFAKICRDDRENPLPSELVMLLYYASIAAAFTRLGARISELPPPPLRRGLKWLLAQPWLEDDMRALLAEGLAQLEAAERLPAEPAKAPAEQAE